ncbi:neurogenic locus protein delta [Coccinella septempunctata]|uniref:neurogenic locus protein delta n=1 Tax=Coccinella septempunctata TaxID=41139 RepID=UPI001D085783|nr:neurogenic locus protein delta [Coccinella septempunctata]XP_044765564.1 neurogenic locus protein delta [Coccinella septempunctata]XP_044765565.1 neurogenic locus protein delta [Coccinella septempunctata]
MSWILMILLGTLLTLQQAASSGMFELRLLSFDNQAGKDDMGKCCTGRTGSDSDCLGTCRPRFRVCLKEYQVKIDTTTPCTFGDTITAELGPNPGSDAPQNSIAFPIQFTWPGTFSLIIEAWHGNQTTQSVLITRLTKQRYLEIGDHWTEDQHVSKFSTIRFEYRVTCDPHYYGKGCENLCRPRDDSFGHYSCSPLGERICHSGWTGDYCSKPQCLPGCDEEHGHCTVPNECKCQAGWEGPLCNKCQKYPGCMHGSCMKPWDCLCDEGWGGLFCNQDLNFCTNHKPCRNGGTCFNTGQGSYTCNCAAEYTGTNCEVPLHDCQRTPCANGGTCAQTSNSSMCICPTGFQGPNCETPVSTCKDNTCSNGGTCVNVHSGFQCNCPPGFTGKNCQDSTNNCAMSPCKNGGSCYDETEGYKCVCPLGFSGSTCEHNIDDCKGNPCQNGGTCIDKVNEFRCQCVSGFVGLLCQTRVDFCITKPCANGGTCIKLLNDYKCKCAPGFTGKDCSEEIDECQFQPCLHGGTCENRLGGFKCHCPPDFAGRKCEEPASSAAPESARVSSESNLTTEHVVVIATISTFVPLVVLIAVGVIICLKQRRKREKARADEEARLQNEQNIANCSFAKRGAAIASDAHMIKNSWGKCTNNVLTSNLSSPDTCSVSNVSVGDCDAFSKPSQVIDGRAVYGLQRSRSQKQLNTEPGPRASAMLVAKLQEPQYEHIKRLSVMSNTSAVCGSSDPSLVKRSEKDPSGVYVIDEHFHRPDAIAAGLFATEV